MTELTLFSILISNVIIKVTGFICVLKAAQYFNNPGILWFWLLVLLVGLNYRTEVKKEAKRTGDNRNDESEVDINEK